MTGKDDLTTLITNYLKTLPGDYTARWKEMERLAGLGEGGAFAAPATHAATHASGGSDPITGPLGPLTEVQIANLGIGRAAVAGYPILMAGPGQITAGSFTIKGIADGTIKLSNSAENDFALLQFGGTTAAFPALQRNGAELQVRTADGANYANLRAATLTTITVAFKNSALIYADVGTPEGAITAVVGSLYLRTDGGANTTLYVKQTGAGNTGWVAK